MALEYTLSIIKPDAVSKNLIGSVVTKIESNGFKIIGQKLLHMSYKQAARFYYIHKERGFFNELVTFMSSGAIVAQVLEKDNAVVDYRILMGTTDPSNADIGTIRREFGENIEKNAVHGSDSLENVQNEISFFFAGIELA